MKLYFKYQYAISIEYKKNYVNIITVIFYCFTVILMFFTVIIAKITVKWISFTVFFAII